MTARNVDISLMRARVSADVSPPTACGKNRFEIGRRSSSDVVESRVWSGVVMSDRVIGCSFECYMSGALLLMVTVGCAAVCGLR